MASSTAVATRTSDASGVSGAPDLRRRKTRRVNIVATIVIVVLAIVVGLLAARFGSPRSWDQPGAPAIGIETPTGQGSP